MTSTGFKSQYSTECARAHEQFYLANNSGDYSQALENAKRLEACALGMGDEELAAKAQELGALAAGKIAAKSTGENSHKRAAASGAFLARFSETLLNVYGDSANLPVEVKQALAKLSAARGSSAFAAEAAKIINELRLSPETYPAFEIGTALLANLGGEFLAAAKSLEASAASGIIGDKAASFAYDFIFGNPENTLLPLYAAGKLGKLVEGLTALGAEALGVTRAATTALKTTTGLATEAPVFVGTGKIVAYEKGKPVTFDAGTFFKESFSSGLVFGGLKAAGFFAQTFNLFLPSTEAGRALSFWNANFASVGALMAVSGAERLAAGEHAEPKSNLDAFVEACVVHLGLTKMMGSLHTGKVGSEYFALLENIERTVDVIRRAISPLILPTGSAGRLAAVFPSHFFSDSKDDGFRSSPTSEPRETGKKNELSAQDNKSPSEEPIIIENPYRMLTNLRRAVYAFGLQNYKKYLAALSLYMARVAPDDLRFGNLFLEAARQYEEMGNRGIAISVHIEHINTIRDLIRGNLTKLDPKSSEYTKDLTSYIRLINYAAQSIQVAEKLGMSEFTKRQLLTQLAGLLVFVGEMGQIATIKEFANPDILTIYNRLIEETNGVIEREPVCRLQVQYNTLLNNYIKKMMQQASAYLGDKYLLPLRETLEKYKGTSLNMRAVTHALFVIDSLTDRIERELAGARKVGVDHLITTYEHVLARYRETANTWRELGWGHSKDSTDKKAD